MHSIVSAGSLAAEQARDDSSQNARERVGGTFTLSLDRLREDGVDIVAPDEEGVDTSKTDNLRAAIDELPEAQRDVVNALFYERVTEAALAERIGVSRALIRKRRDQALTSLQTKLGIDLAASA